MRAAAYGSPVVAERGADIVEFRADSRKPGDLRLSAGKFWRGLFGKLQVIGGVLATNHRDFATSNKLLEPIFANQFKHSEARHAIFAHSLAQQTFVGELLQPVQHVDLAIALHTANRFG